MQRSRSSKPPTAPPIMRSVRRIRFWEWRRQRSSPLGPQGVLTQAERYSKAIDQQPRYQGEFGAPFLYSTNGEEIWFHDIRHALNRSRRVAGFHTPSAPTEMLTRDPDAELASSQRMPISVSSAVPSRSQHRYRADDRGSQTEDADHDGDWHRQDAYDWSTRSIA